MPLTDVTRRPAVDHDHVVRFYRHDEELIRLVGDYLMRAHGSMAMAVVAATPHHIAAFDAELSARGVDIRKAREAGDIVTIDAEEMSTALTWEAGTDSLVLDASIGSTIRRAVSAGREVRVYGEIVSVLWQAGHVTAAIQLEAYWNALAAEVPFTLLCAYPERSVRGTENASELAQICRLHSRVSGLEERPDSAVPCQEATAAFEPSRTASREARRFVTRSLAQWGDVDSAEDAKLIVTELVTNSILHARSGFTVKVQRRRDRTVRLEVRDCDTRLPRATLDPSDAPSGRGLALVDRIADRWGCDLLDGGKSVWAELRG